MSRSPVQYPQRQSLDRWLDQILIGNGLAGLVPRKRRGHAPLALKLALLFLGLVALLGLSLGGVFLCLVLAVTFEAVSYYWQRLVPLPRALLRPLFWDRIRLPFYWTLAIGAVLVSLFHADESLLTGLLRGGLLWLCFRGIDDMVRHPERTSSFDGLLDWLERLERQVGRVLSSWLGFASLAIVAGLALALGAPGIWESAGNTGWDRLLVACGGLYLIAMVTLLRSTRGTIRATIEESLQDWDEPQVGELEKVLCPPQSQSVAAARRGKPGCAEQLEEGLAWKDVDRLAARTGAALEITLIQRLRWGAFLASVLAFLLAFAFLATAVFLIVPREVMANWVSPDQADAGVMVLAFGDFEELLSLEFAERVLGLDWSGLDQEPLPKVVFLEAAILASLMLFRTAADRSALKLLAGAEPENIRHWLLLGTAYLTLLEREFQYLYHGLATRQVTGGAASSTVKMRNVILLAPSVPTKAGAYRAITGFFQTHGPPELRSPTDLVAVFASSRSAQEWAGRFLRSASPAVEGRQDPALQVFSAPDEGPGKFWIWSEDQLIDLTSFEEAQVYGRFVAN
jgi:hypothetical protein